MLLLYIICNFSYILFILAAELCTVLARFFNTIFLYNCASAKLPFRLSELEQYGTHPRTRIQERYSCCVVSFILIQQELIVAGITRCILNLSKRCADSSHIELNIHDIQYLYFKQSRPIQLRDSSSAIYIFIQFGFSYIFCISIMADNTFL